jgi:hypothetical protein
MGDGQEPSATPGRSSAGGAETEGPADAGRTGETVGKQTLTQQLPGSEPGSQPAAPPGGAQPGVPAPGAQPAAPAAKTPSIPGTIIDGGPLSDADVDAVDSRSWRATRAADHRSGCPTWELSRRTRRATSCCVAHVGA